MNIILSYRIFHEFIILFKRILQTTNNNKEHIANFFHWYYAQQKNYSVRVRLSKDEYYNLISSIKEAILEREGAENLILGLSDASMKFGITPRSSFMCLLVEDFKRDI